MRKLRSSDQDEETQIDISPLIDCVFILLIFFIVTTRFIDESGFAVERPQPSSDPSDAESTSVNFAIDDRGKITYESRQVRVAELRPIISQRLAAKKDAAVIIQVSEKALSGVALQVQDQARLAGARKISFSKTD